MTGLVGGEIGGLIGSVAAFSAKSGYEKCRSQYNRVLAIGKRQGLTADPRKEAAERREKQRAVQAAAWRKAAAQAAANRGTASHTSSHSNTADAARQRDQDYLMQMQHMARQNRVPGY